VSFLEGLPFPLTFAALFGIVVLRATCTYWLGRGAEAGAERTRVAQLTESARFMRSRALVARWGAPVVTLSFLTIGVQTLVNLAAGVTKMPLRRYLPAVILGSMLWALLYATAGVVGFAAWQRLYHGSPRAALGIGLALLAVLAGYVWWQLTRRGAAEQVSATARTR
jgi:membrane protein DedA with SNARE-associated domain